MPFFLLLLFHVLFPPPPPLVRRSFQEVSGQLSEQAINGVKSDRKVPQTGRKKKKITKRSHLRERPVFRSLGRLREVTSTEPLLRSSGTFPPRRRGEKRPCRPTHLLLLLLFPRDEHKWQSRCHGDFSQFHHPWQILTDAPFGQIGTEWIDPFSLVFFWVVGVSLGWKKEGWGGGGGVGERERERK